MAALGLTVLAMSPPADAQRTARPLEVTVPVRFVVAHEASGAPVRDAAWLDTQVRWANRVFAPSGIQFEPLSERSLATEHAHLESRRDRHALARHVEAGLINVFVVGSMRDVDDPTQMRRGVHWRSVGRPDRHYLVLTSIGPPTTLAHELGHYFGNRRHRWVDGNIMSYRHGPDPRFDPDQLRRVVRTAREELRRRLIYPTDEFARLVRRGHLPSRWRPRQ